ncbi:MAG: hypothetical protein ACYTDY_04460 [Planctomycetota bacterium]|jgi:hypothetical protein
MKCEEYRRWFEVALRGTLPEEWPAEDYRRHLVSCPQCQMLLALDDVAGAIAEVAERVASTEGGAADERLVRHVRRKARRAKALKVSSFVLGALLLAAGGLVAIQAFTGNGEVPETVGHKPAAVLSPEEFARQLSGEAFEATRAYQVRSSRKLFLGFERQDPAASQYEWAKKVLLSGLAEAFPAAPLFTVSIGEGGKNILKVQIQREQLLGLATWQRELGGPDFCRQLNVLFDRQGLAKRRDDE